jgi:hypothetical protein
MKKCPTETDLDVNSLRTRGFGFKIVQHTFFTHFREKKFFKNIYSDINEVKIYILIIILMMMMIIFVFMDENICADFPFTREC